MEEFKKEENINGMNPVDYFNTNYTLDEIVKFDKNFEVKDGLIFYGKDQAFDENLICIYHCDDQLITGRQYSAFQLLQIIRFDNNYRRAIQFIEFKYLNADFPYIRIGVDYFKIIEKENRYGVNLTELKVWNKSTIIDDHGKNSMRKLHLFDDFTIEPNNIDYEKVIGNMWNLYQPFPHKPYHQKVSIDQMPTTANFMAHIFGSQIELGYIYMKVLYEFPKQILPVLTLVSEERQTGKTTFLNWLDMIFGNNYVMVSPDDLVNQFNSTYAYKNIIGIDEAVVDKQSAIEKIKSIATANTLTVNEKNVSQYRLPFFGKLIITTNKESDFIRIDKEEIRFWVRKIEHIKNLNAKIERNLLAEIPKFLRYLQDLPSIDFSRSRMVFLQEEIDNEFLQIVKKESKSTLHKDLEILIADHFENNQHINEFEASVKDIKAKWFDHNTKYSHSYIKKVLDQEMKVSMSRNKRYRPFGEGVLDSKSGTPFYFLRAKFKIEEKQPF